MKVIIEAINTPSVWQLPGDIAELRIYALSTFMSSNGQWIPAGRVGDPNSFYLPIPCTIDSANVLLIPSFEIDSTVDALENPNALYTAVLYARGKYVVLLDSFAVNTLELGDPSHTWAEIILLKQANAPYQVSNDLLRQIASMIQLAAGALTKGSSTNVGGTALTTDPFDPAFPVAVSASDPNWFALLALLTAPTIDIHRGVATLVNGEVEVPNTDVADTSRIVATSASADVTGNLRVEVVDILAGTSFIIRSNQPGDNGEVNWIF